MARERLEGLGNRKNSMTSGLEPATFRLIGKNVSSDYTVTTPDDCIFPGIRSMSENVKRNKKLHTLPI
jgi:hypothetical protein